MITYFSSANTVVTQAIAPAINIIAIIAALVCTLFLVIGGYTYITSSGNPENLIRAKRIIKNAVIGLVIVLSASLLSSVLRNLYGPINSNPGAVAVPTLNSIKPSSSSGLINVLIKTIAGVLGSVISTVGQPFLKALGYFTSGTPLAASNHAVFNLWVTTVGIADSLLVIVLMIMGLHVMGFISLGLEEINIKQILPKVGFVFVAINSSIFAIDFVIGLSNILIKAVGGDSSAQDVWKSLSYVVKQPSAYSLAALIIMTIFLVFSIILIIYYVGRIVTIYLGAVLAPLVILCWLLPSLRDMATSATKRYFSAIFVLFIHVIILELAASLLTGMAASNSNNPDPIMAMVVGLATLIALLKTQGVMSQLSFAAIGPRMTRRIAERMVMNVSYMGAQTASAVAGVIPFSGGSQNSNYRKNSLIGSTSNINKSSPTQKSSSYRSQQNQAKRKQS